MTTKKEYKNIWAPEMETLSMCELRENIEKPLLTKQLRHVIAHSEFYREKFSKLGILEEDINASGFDISILPFTEKKEVISDQENSPPFGKFLAVPKEEIVRIHRTSGYSGHPALIGLTSNDAEDTAEAGARMFWCAGVRPDDIVIHCLNYCLWIGGITDHMALENTGATVVPFGVGNTRKLLELIRHLKPTAISCTPSYLSRLEKILKEEFGLLPRDLGIKKGIFGGEPGIQSVDIRTRIETKWGMKAIDANYGVSDVMSAFGSECEVRDGLHFHGQGIIYPELIDPERGESIAIEKGKMGEMVYTNLKREAQPLVRFRARDIVVITHVGKCECGRDGFRFKVLGRSDDMIVVKGVNIFPNAIENFLAKFNDLVTGEFEILLGEGPTHKYLDIRVEYKDGLSVGEKGSVKEMLQEKIREDLTFTAKIEMVPHGAIPRTDGKVRRIREMIC